MQLIILVIAEVEDPRNLPSPLGSPPKIMREVSRPFRSIKDASQEVKDVDEALDDQISAGEYICYEHQNPYELRSQPVRSGEQAAFECTIMVPTSQAQNHGKSAHDDT